MVDINTNITPPRKPSEEDINIKGHKITSSQDSPTGSLSGRVVNAVSAVKDKLMGIAPKSHPQKDNTSDDEGVELTEMNVQHLSSTEKSPLTGHLNAATKEKVPEKIKKEVVPTEDSGQLDQLYNLGMSHQGKDINNQAKYLYQAADRGHKKAIEELDKLIANDRTGEASVIIGNLYEKSIKDNPVHHPDYYSVPLRHYATAAEKGNFNGCYKAAMYNSKGKNGVPKETQIAADYAQKALEIAKEKKLKLDPTTAQTLKRIANYLPH